MLVCVVGYDVEIILVDGYVLWVFIKNYDMLGFEVVFWFVCLEFDSVVVVCVVVVGSVWSVMVGFLVYMVKFIV